MECPCIFEIFCVSKIKNDGFWGSWTCPLGPKIMKMKGLWVFGKVNVESHLSDVKQNNSTKLLGDPKFKIYGRNGPSDPRPQIGIFFEIPYRAPIGPL